MEPEGLTPKVIKPPRELNFLAPKPAIVKKKVVEEPPQPRVAIEHDTTFTFEETPQELKLAYDPTPSVEETLEQEVVPSPAEEVLVIDTTAQEEQILADSSPVDVLATTETSLPAGLEKEVESTLAPESIDSTVPQSETTQPLTTPQ